MNSRVFLVLTVHKVAAAAKFAITARASEKADADPLADLPTANAGSHRVNAPDDLVAGNTRISNAGETSLDCGGVRVANTTRLDANAHLVLAGILKRPPHFSELSWFPYLNGFVGLTHFRSSHSFSLLAVRYPGAEAILSRRIQRIGSTPKRVRNRRSTIRPSARQIGIRQRASGGVKQSKFQQIIENSDVSASTRSR